MDIVNLKVKHKTQGIGTIIEFNEKYIFVEFSEKTIQFVYPDAFEKFLKFEDAIMQVEIDKIIYDLKKVEEEKKALKEAERKAKEEQRKIIVQNGAKVKKAKKLDEMFSEDYHVAHLARQPILTYHQVEEQFGIKISGFGRGINPTPTTVVLISSIGKADGNFVYHDKWTPDGDYLYSGEGKTGDQKMTKGNLAIKNAKQDGKKIHLFVKFSPQEYYYQGVFELVDYTYDDDKDEAGNIRKEYKFRLRKVE